MASSPDEKAVLTRIIEAYREFTCLWDTSNPSYHNKDKRNEAFKILLSIYQKARPHSTLKDLKKKLDNMKTTWKSESRKVKNSLIGGCEVYVPTLWYYEPMLFLEDNQPAQQGAEADSLDSTVIKIEAEADPGAFEDLQPSDPAPFQGVTSQSRLDKRKWRQEMQYPLIDKRSMVEPMNDDDWDVIGKALGVQLKHLCREQRCIAQKLFADTLYYGNVGKLNDFSRVVIDSRTVNPIHVPFGHNSPSSHSDSMVHLQDASSQAPSEWSVCSNEVKGAMVTDAPCQSNLAEYTQPPIDAHEDYQPQESNRLSEYSDNTNHIHR